MPRECSRKGATLLAALQQCDRAVFSTEQVRMLAGPAGLATGYVNEALHYLARAGFVVRLCRGTYLVREAVGDPSPARLYAIAMSLARPAVISHACAAYHHGLVDEAPAEVIVLTTLDGYAPMPRIATGRKPGIDLLGTHVRFVRVPSRRLFGVVSSVARGCRYQVTSLERTLVDGLVRPWHFGGMSRVRQLFSRGRGCFDPSVAARHAMALGHSAARRLGWMLESCGVEHSALRMLRCVPASHYSKLDPRGPDTTAVDRGWRLYVNT